MDLSVARKKNLPKKQMKNKVTWKEIKKNKTLLLMLVPGLVFFLIFSYIPMYGVVLAFKDFKILEGIMKSPWVGFKYFEMAFDDPYFYKTVWNTLVISTYKLVFNFPIPIIFALLLNEVRNLKFKKVVQTVSYLPHFMSWVILGGIFFSLFSLDGPINAILEMIGMEKKMFLADTSIFRTILVTTDAWKGFGWGSIIYLAAITGVDQQLYEAANLDGANKLQIARYITLPCILPVISISLILSLSGILNAGFDQVFNLYNPVVYEVADIIDTYVYRQGLQSMQYSYSTAIGLFKSVIGLIMIIGTNFVVKKISGKENALW